MGDPRKQRRKYERPKHPWQAERITQENELCRKYGLKNKTEVWRARSVVGRFREQARKLLGEATGLEAEKRKNDLLGKLKRLGIIEAASVEDVLSLDVESLLERRLQTMVYKKNLANTISQARQYVVHGHVMIGNNAINVPGYIVPKSEEDLIKVDERIIKVVNVDEGKIPSEGKA